ncbi:MAG TPA: nucleotide sugar dehydrogenase [bacterium]|nr:nucleotide sugar dehydrogenase [bacterium]
MDGAFAKKIADRTAIIAVVGLGYVGLPLARIFASAGYRVFGVEIDRERVDAINGGKSYVDDISDDEIAALVARGLLSATSDVSVQRDADAILICVPTPLTRGKQPDLSYVTAAVTQIVPHLRPGQLIVLESTTFPGTTREVVKPILERSGLVAGQDFWLAFSPERLDPGNKSRAINTVPKIVGGLTPWCTELASLMYRQITATVVPVSSSTVAEMVKVYENVFRNVNIALVNELTLLCDRMGLDVWEIIDAAATKPYGFMPFYPGPGVGGHCIPVDPYYLSAKAREYDFHARFIELAATVNDSMPYYALSRTTTALGAQGKVLGGTKVLVLGVAYKKDISDVRESPSLKIIELLEKRGANVAYHDPYIPEITLPNPGVKLTSVSLTDERLSEVDCVIIATDHSNLDYRRVAEKARLVIDTRNVLRGTGGPHVVRL